MTDRTSYDQAKDDAKGCMNSCIVWVFAIVGIFFLMILMSSALG